ncbi:HET-domain-containing protein, partial [Stipitochalara longipes BDJ]
MSRITSKFEGYLANVIFRLNARVYMPLHLNSGTFRLLTIWPAESSDSVKCTLEVASWQNSEYEALSYAWGDKRLFRSISIDDKTFFVTSELFAALHELRSETTKRVLWVDAICINQHDAQERERQVHQMDHIYRNAKKVVVWLGKQYSYNTSRALGNLGQNDLSYYALERLFHCQWWQRIWVVQEVALASKVAFQYGPYSID